MGGDLTDLVMNLSDEVLVTDDQHVRLLLVLVGFQQCYCANRS
jgi:hypothetical protein